MQAIAIRTNARVGDFDEEDEKIFLRLHGAAGAEDLEAAGPHRSRRRAFLGARLPVPQ